MSVLHQTALKAKNQSHEIHEFFVRFHWGKVSASRALIVMNGREKVCI